MRKSLRLVFASLIVIGGLSIVSFAQTARHNHYGRWNINQRQENQQDRIAQGINSGSLTAAEAARLEKQEARINRVEDRYRDSGNGLNLKERYRLERALNRESRNIYRQKHDKQGQKP